MFQVQFNVKYSKYVSNVVYIRTKDSGMAGDRVHPVYMFLEKESFNVKLCCIINSQYYLGL